MAGWWLLQKKRSNRNYISGFFYSLQTALFVFNYCQSLCVTVSPQKNKKTKPYESTVNVVPSQREKS